MFIELRGVEFVNKGAELMLHAILQYLKEQLPDAEFVMETSHRSPKSKLDSLGIFEKARLKKKGFDLTFLYQLSPKSVLRKKRMVLDQEISAVLDASGFAYGDKWGAKKAAQRSGDPILTWRSQGKKVIFLPQAFGPFSSQSLQEQMKKIVKNSDLVFARDDQSLEYLKALTPENSAISLAPDFTNLVTVNASNLKSSYEDKILIIPNQKMLETDSQEINENYISFLATLVSQLKVKGELPLFLIHESNKDAAIAESVNQHLESPIPIVKEDNSLVVKAIIGASKGVVTSRFHGLVSALSQAIPCLSTGWSHKYQELMKDYQYEEGMCDVSLEKSYLSTKLDLILSEKKREEVHEKLKENSTLQKERSKAMWAKVLNCLKG